MNAIFNLIAQNHVSVAAAIGTLMVLAGVVLCFVAGARTHGLVLALVGSTFTALPFVTTMKLGTGGIEFLFNSQDQLKATVKQQTAAIREIKTGLGTLNEAVKDVADTTPKLGIDPNAAAPAAPTANWLRLKQNLATSLDNSDALLDDIHKRQQELDQLMEKNRALLGK